MNPVTLGWLWETASNFALGVFATCTVVGCWVNDGKKPQQDTGPRPPIVGQRQAGERVIATAKIDGENRCKIGGELDGVPLTFMVDTGAPRSVEISTDVLAKLGRTKSQYDFEELWPGTRYGKIAKTTVNLRIGDLAITNANAFIYDRWEYTFGHPEIPLLGMGALKNRGVRLEIEGSTCKLVMPQTVTASTAPAIKGESSKATAASLERAAQRATGKPVAKMTASPVCNPDTLTKLAVPKLESLCRSECSYLPLCMGVTGKLGGRSDMDRLIAGAR
jgi:hypothetical protein